MVQSKNKLSLHSHGFLSVLALGLALSNSLAGRSSVQNLLAILIHLELDNDNLHKKKEDAG